MGLAKRYWEEVTARGFGISDFAAVCLKCIHDPALSEETAKCLEEWSCTFCGAEADEARDEPIAASFEDFMYIFMRAVNFLYMSVDDAGLAYDEGEWFGGHVLHSADVAYSVGEGDVTDAVMEAITDSITEQLWTDSHISESPPDVALRWGWEAFRNKVKHETRFVFLATPEKSSDHPDEFTTAELLARIEQIIMERDVLLSVPRGQVYWRGRLIDDPDKWAEYRSAAVLGSAPKDQASNNRMSPAGISLFYGGTDVATVVAEIGAHSARRHAVVGAFETTRELTFLNLADLPPLPSLYREDPPGREYYELKFLRAFAVDISAPVVFDGREHIDYVPTQVITEYLRFVTSIAIDGVLFRSAQNGGVNCVIFCGPDGCVDPDTPPSKPWQKSTDVYLRLKPETVQRVRIVAQVHQS